METINVIVASDICRKQMDMHLSDGLATAFISANIPINSAKHFAINGEGISYDDVMTKKFSDYCRNGRCVLACYAKASADMSDNTNHSNHHISHVVSKPRLKNPQHDLPISILDLLLTVMCAVLLFIAPIMSAEMPLWLTIVYYFAAAYIILYSIVLVLKVIAIIYVKCTDKTEFRTPDDIDIDYDEDNYDVIE